MSIFTSVNRLGLFRFLRVSHVVKATLIFGLLYTVYRLRTEPLDQFSYVDCPNHMAIEMPSEDPFHGRYIRCEHFNRYQSLIEHGELKEAELLLIDQSRVTGSTYQ